MRLPAAGRAGQHAGVDTVLTTERMLLRRFTAADVDSLVELDRDPAVMRYLTNGKPTPFEVVRDEMLPALLAEYERTAGYGRLAAVHRTTGEFLGWFGLSQRGAATDEAEVGYRLRQAWWGQGYATEGCRALIDAAFADLRLRRVYAETMAVNRASRRVMEKSGMRHVRTFHLHFDDPVPGTEHGEVEYELRRADWLSRRVAQARS